MNEGDGGGIIMRGTRFYFLMVEKKEQGRILWVKITGVRDYGFV